MFVVQHKKTFIALSALFVVLSLISVFVYGLTFGVDFTGGTLVEVQYTEGQPSVSELQNELATAGFGATSVRESGDGGYIVRLRPLEEGERGDLFAALSADGERQMTEERFALVGPTIGQELRQKAYWAIGAILLIIVLFIAFAFRKVSKPVSSWRYGFIAIIALAHDVIVPVGLFAFLGAMYGAEIDALFVTALLAILGYSVNDTIVVFDRVRENVLKNRETHTHEAFEDTVGKSLNQTYARSINTSVTTLVVLLTLVILGGGTIHNFVITLIAGVIAGTYSSIFLASPLLVLFAKGE